MAGKYPMFSYLTQLIYRFHSKPVQTVALAGLVTIIAAVLLASLVSWLRRRNQDRPETWAGLLVASIGNVLKVLIGLGLLVIMCIYLDFQSDEFARQRGGTSQRNYESVMTIWGRPHVQRELTCKLMYETVEYYDKDGMEIDANKLKATTQPVGFRKQTIQHVVPGNPIISAEHTFDIAANYREKGGAYYPGFDVDGSFTYKFVSFADRDLEADFNFPLPSRQGLVDQIRVTLDGKPLKQKLLISETSIRWRMPVKSGVAHDLAISYHSRGLNDLRFEPGAGRELGKYRLTMICRDIEKDRINYPVGCMTPTDPMTQTTMKNAKGEDIPVTTLTWNLEKAVTRLGMGFILPKKTQPGYYVARVLAAAPWGLALLLAVVIATFLATGDKLRGLPIAIVAGGYMLYYLLMAHIGDYWPGLTGGMIIAGLVLMTLEAAFLLVWCRRFQAISALGLLGVFCLAYPLIRISDYEGLLLTSLYVALFAWIIALLIAFRKKDVPQ